MNLKQILCAAATLAVAVAFVAPAAAVEPYGFVINGNYGGLPRSYQYRVPVPPYFAVHPPVYYSHRVYRPYGLSPYAWPATPRNYARAQQPPQMVYNPFTPQAESQAEGDAVATVQPQMVYNPFVTETDVRSQLATSKSN
ncbi:MAG TPA: hypothetical protein DCY79_02870 [Planctomycetaceae bacterium]|nr:hypothetical protein [Blastopirellula sp.]HAY78733.1 hypothetical protein [Planctomycetaceae bacterium]